MKVFIDVVARLSLFAILFILMQIVAAWLLPLLSFGGDIDLGRFLGYSLSMILMIIVLRVLNRATLLHSERVMTSYRGLNPLVALYGVLVIVALSITLAPLNDYMPVDSREFSDSVWTLVLVVIAAPIFEEILFRGRLYGLLRTKTSPLVSVMLSALLFGVLHLQPSVMAEGLLVGIVFSYAYLRTKSIVAPIILHMCNNALAYTLEVLSYGERPLLELIDNREYFLVIYVVSALFAVVSLGIMIGYIVRYGRENSLPVESPDACDENEDNS